MALKECYPVLKFNEKFTATHALQNRNGGGRWKLKRNLGRFQNDFFFRKIWETSMVSEVKELDCS